MCACISVFLTEPNCPGVKNTMRRTQLPWVTLSKWSLSLFVSLCRCVEIIAKEGRSLKELYLVSCKITDHGRILSITVPLLQSTSKIIIATIITPVTAMIQDSFCFYGTALMRLQTVKLLLKSFSQNKVTFAQSLCCCLEKFSCES